MAVSTLCVTKGIFTRREVDHVGRNETCTVSSTTVVAGGKGVNNFFCTAYNSYSEQFLHSLIP